jgi:chromate transporter
MTDSQFLAAVALGQITPGPVVQTVAVVGYAAAGIGGGVLAAAVAFAPSFAFVLVGARHFQALRANAAARAFLDGAGPAAVGAIFGVAVPLALALSEAWQYAVLAGAAVSLLLLRRSVVSTLLLAAGVGILVVQLGAPLPGGRSAAGDEHVLAAVAVERLTGEAAVEGLQLEAGDVEQAQPLVLRGPPQ